MRMRGALAAAAIGASLGLVGTGVAEARFIDPPPGARTATVGEPCPGAAGEVARTAVGVAIFCAKAPRSARLRWRFLDSSTHRLVGALDRLYTAYFQREPDGSGFAYWIGRRVNGTSLDEISDAFAASGELRAAVGPLTDGAFVDLLWNRIMRQPLWGSNRDYWILLVGSGTITRGEFVTLLTQLDQYRRDTGTA